MLLPDEAGGYGSVITEQGDLGLGVFPIDEGSEVKLQSEKESDSKQSDK